MHSSTLVSYVDIQGERYPVYGCGKTRRDLKKFYDMKSVKEKNICRDWLNNGCAYQYGRSNHPNRMADECSKRHELPPIMSLTKRLKLQKKSTNNSLPLNRRVTARKPRVTITYTGNTSKTPSVSTDSLMMESQTTQESVSGEDKTVPGAIMTAVDATPVPECETEAWTEELSKVPYTEPVEKPTAVLVPELHQPAVFQPVQYIEPPNHTAEPELYKPADFEPVSTAPFLDPRMVALNAFAPEYAPSAASNSHSGSCPSVDQAYDMSTTYTPAPSIPGSVNGDHMCGPVAPPRVPTYFPQPAYSQVQYVHPNTVAAIQEQNSKLLLELNALKAANANSLKASQDEVRNYQAELLKAQKETARMAFEHEEAMKRLRHDYDTQIEVLRKQQQDALAALNYQEQRARVSAARLRKMEIASAKKELVQKPAVMQHQNPAEEVAKPEETITLFTYSPMTSVAIQPMAQVTLPIATPPKPLSELAPRKPVEPEKTVEEEPAAVVETPAATLEDAPGASAEAPVRRRKRRARKRAVVEPTPGPIVTNAPLLTPDFSNEILQEELLDEELLDVNEAVPVASAHPTPVDCWASKTMGSARAEQIKPKVYTAPGRRYPIRAAAYVAKVSKEELKYRERKSGAKKTRMSKRDRFYRQNQLSLKAARMPKQNRTARKRVVKVCGTGIAAKPVHSYSNYMY